MQMHRAVAQWDALQTANYKFGPGSQHDPNEVNLSCHKWKRRKRWNIYNSKYLSYSNKFRPQLVGKTHHRGSVSLAWPPACNLRSILRLPPKLKWKPHFSIRVREKSIRSRTLLRHIVAVHRRAQGRATRHPIKSSTSAESVQVNPSNTDCPGLMNTLLHLEESRVGLSKKCSESPGTSTEMMAGPWCPCER